MKKVNEARAAVNVHVREMHAEYIEEFFSGATDEEARLMRHEVMHASGEVTVPHTHEPSGEVVLPDGKIVVPAKTQSMRKAMNVHMHWKHGGLPASQHERLHEVLGCDHSHEWPLTEDALVAANEKMKRERLT